MGPNLTEIWGVVMSIPTGLEVVTDRAGKEAILAAPEIARRLPSHPVNVNDPAIYFLREADGPAVIRKQGPWDYSLVAPSLQEASPHVHRLIDWIFNESDGLNFWFDSELYDIGAELGADPSGCSMKQTRDDGKTFPKMFATWRLRLEPRIDRHEPIRVEGGRVRRSLVKAGAVLPNNQDRDKEAHDRRLGFLSLAAAGGQPVKGIAAYDEYAVLHGLTTIRRLASKPVIELEILGVRVKIIDGKLEAAAGRA